MNEAKLPEYVGDGIYVQEGRFPGEIILTAGSHEIPRAENVIYIDPAYIPHLLKYMNEVVALRTA